MGKINKIYIGSDHRGFTLRKQLIAVLRKNHPNIGVIDCGPIYDLRCDYPIYAKKVCESVIDCNIADNSIGNSVGILICGTGVGMSIAANRFTNIRCCLGYDLKAIEMGRLHNDCNVLALSADLFSLEENYEFIKRFVNTQFLNEDPYVSRIKMLDS